MDGRHEIGKGTRRAGMYVSCNRSPTESEPSSAYARGLDAFSWDGSSLCCVGCRVYCYLPDRARMLTVSLSCLIFLKKNGSMSVWWQHNCAHIVSIIVPIVSIIVFIVRSIVLTIVCCAHNCELNCLHCGHNCEHNQHNCVAQLSAQYWVHYSQWAASYLHSHRYEMHCLLINTPLIHHIVWSNAGWANSTVFIAQYGQCQRERGFQSRQG